MGSSHNRLEYAGSPWQFVFRMIRGAGSIEGGELWASGIEKAKTGKSTSVTSFWQKPQKSRHDPGPAQSREFRSPFPTVINLTTRALRRLSPARTFRFRGKHHEGNARNFRGGHRHVPNREGVGSGKAINSNVQRHTNYTCVKYRGMRGRGDSSLRVLVQQGSTSARLVRSDCSTGCLGISS